jgi:hypothetical protein
MGMKVILRLQHGTIDWTAIGDDENSFKFFFCFAIKLAVIEVSPDPFPK